MLLIKSCHARILTYVRQKVIEVVAQVHEVSESVSVSDDS